jgi:hypothetical protein
LFKFIRPFTLFLRRSSEKVTGKVEKILGGVMEDWRVWASSVEGDPQIWPARNGSGFQDVEEDFPRLLRSRLLTAVAVMGFEGPLLSFSILRSRRTQRKCDEEDGHGLAHLAFAQGLYYHVSTGESVSNQM